MMLYNDIVILPGARSETSAHLHLQMHHKHLTCLLPKMPSRKLLGLCSRQEPYGVMQEEEGEGRQEGVGAEGGVRVLQEGSDKQEEVTT